MQSLQAGLAYFILVFAAGFALGTIRTLWVVPRVGARTAELMETPVMLAISLLAARWTVLRFAVPAAPFVRLATGCVALAFLLVAEFGMVRFLRGMPIKQYFASRDRVSGTVYYVALAIFAIMPLLVARG